MDGIKYAAKPVRNAGVSTMIENLAERRQNTTKIVRELLEERRQVWALYCDIGGIQPFTARQPLEGKLQEFRQLLIDYISLGHFGLYQRITDGTERRRKVLEVAEQIYPRIAAATDVAVAFNDKYEMLASVASWRSSRTTSPGSARPWPCVGSWKISCFPPWFPPMSHGVGGVAVRAGDR